MKLEMSWLTPWLTMCLLVGACLPVMRWLSLCFLTDAEDSFERRPPLFWVFVKLVLAFGYDRSCCCWFSALSLRRIEGSIASMLGSSCVLRSVWNFYLVLKPPVAVDLVWFCWFTAVLDDLGLDGGKTAGLTLHALVANYYCSAASWIAAASWVLELCWVASVNSLLKAVLDLGKLARPGFELVVEVTDLNFEVL